MGVRGLVVSSAFTVLSFVGLHFWTELSIERFLSEGLIGNDYTRSENLGRVVELLVGSSFATVLLLLNFVVNVIVLLVLSLKNVFFGELHSSETRKLVERLVNYVIYKNHAAGLPFHFRNVLEMEMQGGTRPISLEMFPVIRNVPRHQKPKKIIW